MAINSRKVAMVGCGFVGSASAFALMQSKLFSEMVLIDADQNRAEGEALDISHGMAFASPMKIYAGTYDDVSDAAIIVITAGANQKPEETRLDLTTKLRLRGRLRRCQLSVQITWSARKQRRCAALLGKVTDIEDRSQCLTSRGSQVQVL